MNDLLIYVITLIFLNGFLLNAMKVEQKENSNNSDMSHKILKLSAHKELKQMLLDRIDNTALSYKEFLEENACVNVQNKHGRTIFMFAAAWNKVEHLEELINLGVHINKQDKKGLSALSYAIINDARESLVFLIKAGADINTKDIRNRTAFKIAENWQRIECMKIILLAAIKKIFTYEQEKCNNFVYDLAQMCKKKSEPLLEKLLKKEVRLSIIFDLFIKTIIKSLHNKVVNVSTIDALICKYY